MGKGMVYRGDKTSHGGVVLTGFSNSAWNGIPQARLGEVVFCPKCKPHRHTITQVSGFNVHGVQSAVHGDLTSCGATLIAETASPQDMAAAVAHLEGRGFDERFHLQDERGNPSSRTAINVLKLSSNGERFIKDWEVLRLNHYDDVNGFCTVGWGHLVAKQSCASLGLNGKHITPDEAQQLFDKDKPPHEALVKSVIHVPLHQHEYDALVSLAFNVGSLSKQAPALCKKINAGLYTAAAAEFLDITNKGIPGLVKRRQQENQMFLNADYTARH